MSLEEQFIQFHEENPHVFEELKKLALSLKKNGRNRYGVKALFEVLRYHSAIKTSGTTYRFNNNYTSFYARKLMEEVPELEGFFEIRKQRSA